MFQHPTTHDLAAIQAPVRISFGGGGTDLPAYYRVHGGLVLSTAITAYAQVHVTPTVDKSIVLVSQDYGLVERWEAGCLPVVAEPLRLVKAAVERYGAALQKRGARIAVRCAVPPGTGLGSSSAVAVALVTALAQYCGETLGKATAAERACELELGRLAMPIGKQDQYASAFGGLNLIHFTGEDVKVTPVVIGREVTAALDERLLLWSTGKSRDAATILQHQAIASGTQLATIERLHHLKHLAWEMHAALQAADLDGFGRLLDQAWREKRQLSRGISSDAIDAWYRLAQNHGALGGKITGAGGGGFLLLYCPLEQQKTLRMALSDAGLRELQFNFDWQGVQPV